MSFLYDRPCRRRHTVGVLFVLVVLLVLPASIGGSGTISPKGECIIAADGTETCDKVVDKCTDALGTDKCQRLVAKKDNQACIKSFDTMRTQCAQTCHLCDENLDLQVMEKSQAEDRFVLKRLYSQEFPQIVEGAQRVDTYRHLLDVDQYMYETVYTDDDFQKVRLDCQNRHELCTFWAFLGECDKNPNYMKKQCAPSCFSCEELDFDKRCPYDPDAPTALGPGDLDAMFQRILTDPELAQYSPKAILQPNPPPDQEESKKGPWIVVLENFLSQEECDTMIRLGAEKGYEISKDVGERNFDGTYDGIESKERTSSNAWCTEECWEDPVTQAVHDRIELLTGINRTNYEYLQILRYEEGQFYGKHHDYIEHHNQREPGVRTLTVFLYLNDVEKGGGTHFSRLKQTIMPKRGRAVIWPSVLNDNPNKKDHQTDHEALPVEAGIKYGANAWVHQRDFKTAWSKGCH